MSRVKLSQILHKPKENKCGSRTLPVLSCTQHDGLVLQSDKYKKQIASEDVSGYLVVTKNQLVQTFHMDKGVLSVWKENYDGIVSPAYKVWNVDTDMVLPEYLEYALKSPASIDYYLKHAKTTVAGRCAVNDYDFLNLEIVVPDKQKQKDIVAVINQMDKVYALQMHQLELLEELVKSRFIELFGLPVSNSKGWNTEKMREVAPAVNYSGGFEDTVWLLNLDMVEAQTGRILDYLYVNEEEVGNSTCTFDTTNVLYSKLRPYLNKVVIPDRCGYATSELIPLKPNPMKFERAYLAFMLRSDEFVNMINEKVAGAKMPRVSMSDFREFDVPVPPMELQKQFDAFVEQTDKSKLAVTETLKYLEELKASLMDKYFG